MSKPSRIEKWNGVMESVEKFEKFREAKGYKLKSWVRKGIPPECKGRAWQFLTGSITNRVPGKFQQMVDAPLTEQQIAAISIDLPRTFPKNPHFQQPAERERMRRVLHAYAAHDPAVGYVQGMAFVTGALLFYMSEEDAFWMLDTLMHKYNYHNALIQDFPFVKLCLTQLKHVIKKFTPKLNARLHRGGEVTSVVPVELFSGAFVALLSDAVPWDLFVRVWDSFFVEEWKTIFRLIVALLQHHEARLCAIVDDGELIGSIKVPKLAAGLDVNQLMERAFKVKLRSRTLYKVCKRYNLEKFDEWLAQLDLQGVAMAMQNNEKGVEICDRSHYLKKYTSCFIAQEAVDWLVNFIGNGKLTGLCGVCHPRTEKSKSQASSIASPPMVASSFPGFTGIAMTVDLTNTALPPTAEALCTKNDGSVLSMDPSVDDPADSDADSDNKSPASKAKKSASPVHEEEEGGSDDEEADEWEQAALCWCRAQLGMNTAYYNKLVQDNAWRLEKTKRTKAINILRAMEKNGIIHNAKPGDEETFTDDNSRYYRFGTAIPSAAE